MLTKKSRISKKEFEKALLNCRVFSSESFLLRYNVKKLENKGYFGVVVPKKVAKLAVLRNKIRRRVYGIIQKEQKNLNLKGYFVFFMKKGSENKEFSDFYKEVSLALKKTL